jgi:DNA polymerase-3 subunit delta'
MAFEEILGHERSVSILRRSVASGKTAHAYLFEGIDGCGRRTAATALIQALFCTDGAGCGSCPSCRKMITGNHPDLHLLEPDGAFIKIDQIRELQKELSLRPYEASRKACIIEAAEKMNGSAANAMLKTLEEPPGNAVIVLLTTDASAVLSTIRSRCQLLRFAPLPHDTVRSYLIERGIPPDTAETAAGIARGSIGKAMEISGQETIASRQGQIAEISAVTLSDIAQLFALSERLSADKSDTAATLDTLISFLRDVLILLNGGTDIVNRDLQPLIEQEASRWSPASVMRRIASVMDTRQALQYNANPRLALDQLFIRLAQT